MLLIDIKDFRKMSLYNVPLSEEQIEETLAEAEIDLTEVPLELKVRIKDYDQRNISARMDGMAADGSAFRLNLYFPTWMPDGWFLASQNRYVRHLFAHVAQIRNGESFNPEDHEGETDMQAVMEEAAKQMKVLEQSAWDHATERVKCVVPNLPALNSTM